MLKKWNMLFKIEKKNRNQINLKNSHVFIYRSTAANNDIHFKIYSKNQNGTSVNYSSILVPKAKNRWSPIEVNSNSYKNKTGISLSWVMPDGNKDIVGYTIYSCSRPEKWDECKVSIFL